MNKLDRRQFLGSIAKPAAAASVVLSSPSLMARALDSVKGITGDPKVIARDERYWREIQQAYSADRGIVNLNNEETSRFFKYHTSILHVANS
jgi:hypothetical protein